MPVAITSPVNIVCFLLIIDVIVLCSSCSEITDQPGSCDQSCRDTEYCCCNHYDFPPFVLIWSFIIGSYLEYRYDHKSYGYDTAADKKCCHLFSSFRFCIYLFLSENVSCDSKSSECYYHSDADNHFWFLLFCCFPLLWSYLNTPFFATSLQAFCFFKSFLIFCFWCVSLAVTI